MTVEWSQSHVDDKLIIYSDGSQSSRESNDSDLFSTDIFFFRMLRVGILKRNVKSPTQLYAIQQVIQLVIDKIRAQSQSQIQKIWIFSDSQAALQELQEYINSSIMLHIVKLIQTILQDFTVQIQIHWMSGHENHIWQ